MKQKPPQDKELRVRVSEFDLDVLDSFCKLLNQSRTKTVKKAIKNYIYLNIENKDRPNKKVLFSQNMLKPLLDNVNESMIEEIAEISFQNGISDSELLLETLKSVKNISEVISSNPKLQSFMLTDIEDRVKGLVEGVFSPEAQNWFDDIKFGWNDKILIVGGKHNLGSNFSLFFKCLMIKYMKLYEYKLQKDDYRESQSKTDTKYPIYTVILHFNP
jgi:hypothetical protein